MHSDIEIDYVAMFMSVTYQSGYTHKRYWISEYFKIRDTYTTEGRTKTDCLYSP